MGTIIKQEETTLKTEQVSTENKEGGKEKNLVINLEQKVLQTHIKRPSTLDLVKLFQPSTEKSVVVSDLCVTTRINAVCECKVSEIIDGEVKNCCILKKFEDIMSIEEAAKTTINVAVQEIC